MILKRKPERFKKSGMHLFDVAACKCNTDDCNCKISKHVPKELNAFLCDQRGERQLIAPRKLMNETPFKINVQNDISETESRQINQSVIHHIIASQILQFPQKRKKSQRNKTTFQNRCYIRPIDKQADRFGLSLKATAAVATATLNAFGLVDNNDTKLPINKSKVQQQVSK